MAFDEIIVLGSGSMGIHEGDVSGPQFGHLQRASERGEQPSAPGMRRGEMVRVACGSMSIESEVGLVSARQDMRGRFQDDDPGTFSEVESASALVKRHARKRAAQAERVESAQWHAVQFVRSAREHDVAESCIDPLRAEGDGIRTG